MSSSRSQESSGNSFLLQCGFLAGLLFLSVSFLQSFTRSGFDIKIHALSSLALGELGWIQVANFIVTGLLAIAFAFGLWRALKSGRASKIVPILVGIYGSAMIGGGIFTPDPGLGWPPGAPAGLPEHPSTGSNLHILFGFMAFMSIIVAGLVFIRRFFSQRRYAWALYSGLSSITALVLTSFPWSAESESLRFAAAAVLISSWLAVIACLMLRGSKKPT